MGLRLTAKMEGQTQLSRKLEGIAKKNFKKEMKKIGGNVVNFTKKDVFNSEGAAIGEKWEDGPNYKKLQRTGNLRNSFKYDASTNRVVIYSDSDYFKYHQSRRPRNKLPRRLMLKMTPELKRMAIKEIQKGVEDELKKRI